MTLLPLYLVYLTALAGLGAIVGSFVNVVAYRVPAGMSVVRPRSACPACSTQIRARDNIPVAGWVLLRGRCRDCAAPIPTRYPLVEATVAAMWAAAGVWAWPPNTLGGPDVSIDPLLPLLLALVSFSAALWLIDVDHLRLPDRLVAPLYPVTLVGLTFAGAVSGQWPVSAAVGSGAVWAAVFATIWFGTAGRGMGFGDVKLAPVYGLTLGWVGWSQSLVGLMAGFVVGGAVGGVLLIRAGAGRRTRIPYGPYLMTGAAVGLLLGGPVGEWYTSLVGL